LAQAVGPRLEQTLFDTLIYTYHLAGQAHMIQIAPTALLFWCGIPRAAALSIHHRVALDAYWADHVTANNETPSFVEALLNALKPNDTYVALLSDSVERAMSEFYHFEAYWNHKKTNAQNKVDFLESEESDVMVRQIAPCQSYQSAFEKYVLVGLTERFDESLLLLGHKLGLKEADLIYLRSEVASDVHPGAGHVEWDKELERVENAAAHLQNGADKDAHAYANQLLDQAIVEYGADAFAEHLAEFQFQLNEVSTACYQDQLDHIDCLWSYIGRAQVCIDQLVEERGWQ